MSERFREPYFVSLQRILKTTKVLHVHGQLGRLASGPRARVYSMDCSDRNVRLAARSIKIIHIANPKSDSFRKAKASLRKAARIYFLGFGYDSTNMERLGFRKGAKPRYSGQVFLDSHGLNGTARKELIDDYHMKEIETAAQPSRSIGYVVRDLPWD
jgi:hypothetical protein